MKAIKGHFYYVEKHFKTLDGLKNEMSKKANTMSISVGSTKEAFKKVSSHRDENMLWVITEKGSYVIKDYRLSPYSEEKQKVYTLMSIAKYVYSISTWKVDNYRIRELDPVKECRKVGFEVCL